MSHLKINKNVFLACQITGIYDVNRNVILESNDYSMIKNWCESLIKLDLHGIIFHNNYAESFCEEFSNNNIQFNKINYHENFNPNVFRYLVYNEFLKINSPEIENIFVTDISDVAVVKNPFEESLFMENTSFLFCGDEPKILDNEWMKSHAEHLRSNMEDYAAYEENFKNHPLLNCGIIGGNIKVMQEFIDNLATIHRQYNFDNKTSYTGDMGAFNYLVRTQFNERVKHGFPINTEFKAYQTERNDCWLRHK
jgi:hypothetical protein